MERWHGDILYGEQFDLAALFPFYALLDWHLLNYAAMLLAVFVVVDTDEK